MIGYVGVAADMRGNTSQEEMSGDETETGANRRALLRNLGAAAVTAGLGAATASGGETGSVVQDTRPLGPAEARRSVRAVSTDERAAPVRDTLTGHGLRSAPEDAISKRMKLADEAELAARTPVVTAVPYKPAQGQSGAVGLLYAVTVEDAGGRSVVTTLGFSATKQPAPTKGDASPSVAVSIHGSTADTQQIEQQSVRPADVDLSADEIGCTLCTILSTVVCSRLGEVGGDLCGQICGDSTVCQTACAAIVEVANQELCGNPSSICSELGLCSGSIF